MQYLQRVVARDSAPAQFIIGRFCVLMVVMNKELARIFFEIAAILDAGGESFKPQAYRKAARALLELAEDAALIYARGGLKAVEAIPGVGQSIGQKIEEYVLTGKIDYYRQLKRDFPVDLDEVAGVEGLGPKRAKILYEKLGVKNLRQLEAAARAGKVAPLFGFGPKSQANILQGIEFKKRSGGRFLLNEVFPAALDAKEKISALPQIARVEIAGSLRRAKETIGDVDLLAAPKLGADAKDAAAIMDFFSTLAGIEKIWAKGPTKTSVRMAAGFDIDLRLVGEQSFGAAWQYFTGSKEHNIALRRLAIQKGFKLSEYGLFENDKMAAGETEEGIYQKLGLDWIAPEMRENAGEIEAAQNGKLPRLLECGSLKGDLHCHSNWSDGKNSIEELAAAAMAMGYEYLGVADHTRALKVAGGLDEDRLRQRNAEIDALNEKIRSQGKIFAVLKGCEANIDDDGGIDLDKEILAELDFVIAGVHMNFKMDAKKMTRRLVGAAKNPDIDIISHPTGRLLKERPAYELEIEKVFEVAKEHGAILEINAQPRRLDLKPLHVRGAIANGIKLAINTDAHRPAELEFARFGIAQARRGWATAGDIANTLPWPELKKILKRNQKRVN